MPSSESYTFMSTTGLFYQIMWEKTLQKYPHLGVITDSDYIHAILACTTQEAQNLVLDNYLKLYYSLKS